MHYHQQPNHKAEITNRTSAGFEMLNKTNQTKNPPKKETNKETNRKPQLVSSHQQHHT